MRLESNLQPTIADCGYSQYSWPGADQEVWGVENNECLLACVAISGLKACPLKIFNFSQGHCNF